MSCKWAYTEKTLLDPISWRLPVVKNAMKTNDKVLQNIAKLFPTGNLCSDTKGWFR